MFIISAPLIASVLVYGSAIVTGLTLQRRAVDFFDPAQGGGSIFDNATFGGEPLNVSLRNLIALRRVANMRPLFQVIISGLSSPDVLTDDGILNFAQAIGL